MQRPRPSSEPFEPTVAQQYISAVSERDRDRETGEREALADATSLLDEMPGAVLLLGADGTVRYLNRIAEDRLDLSRAEALGRDFFRDLFPQLEEEGVGERFRTGMQTGDVALGWEASLRTNTGPRRMSIGIRAYRRGEGRWGVALLEDRSALAAEEARRRSAERLAAVGELATGVAHEINNPLASIKSFAQLLAHDADEPQQVQALEIISQECSRVAKTVDRLLAFAGQQRVETKEPLNLTTLAETVLGLKRYVLETSGIEVLVDLDPSVSLVRGEKGAIQRAILILIGKAEDALQERAGTRQLAVRTRESTEGVVLQVMDNGPGIPREKLPVVLEVAGSSPQDGAMGLSTARSIVREHGGRLWAESVEGRGTSFYLTLPRLEAAAVVAPPEPPRAPAPERDRSLRVLIADDEATLRLAVSMYLARHGHVVTEAADAHEALRTATRGAFDVALIDLRMPGDGAALAETLEALPEWHGRTILMTGDHAQALVGEEATGKHYLFKPFDMMEVVRMVEEVGGAPRPASA